MKLCNVDLSLHTHGTQIWCTTKALLCGYTHTHTHTHTHKDAVLHLTSMKKEEKEKGWGQRESHGTRS